MLPTFQFFGRTIAMYGLMIVIGLFVGITIAVIRSKKYNIKIEDVLFSSFFAGVGLFVGSKLLFLLTIVPELITYRQSIILNPALLLPILTKGFVFYGGLLGAALGYTLYCRHYHIKTLSMLDLMTPSIPIIHGFGRLGCYFAGCCYGIIYQGPYHLIFHQSISAPNEVPLFPTQLLESGLNFIAGILLLIYAKPTRKPGKILGLYLIYYLVMRFFIEFFRGDIIRGVLLGITTSQWISIALIPVGLWLLFRKAK
jgi:phosphatidylglycerol:prolipoprotein diacylglycerol transferase